MDLNPDIFFSNDVTRSSPVLYSVNIQDGAERNFIAPLLLGLSWTISHLITCMQLNLAMITVRFNYAKRRRDILKLLFMSERQIRRRKQVKRTK